MGPSNASATLPSRLTATIALAVALVFVTSVAFAGEALAARPHAAVVPAARPLPESDYRVRPLCGPVGPGYAQCFAMELVPQAAAAKERATPLGMTLSRPVRPASAASGAFGLRPQDLHSAYGLASKAPVEQTIGIVDAYDDPSIEADLAVYDEEFGLPECTEANGCFTKVNEQGQASPLPAYDSGWAGEIALDVETAHAVCEERCHIVLVEAESSTNGSLETAEETAIRLGATEISNSFGSPEPASEGSAFNHPGVAITASTGDYGYLNWDSTQLGFPSHPNYPASSPDVVAVGGTRLSLNNGAWEKETVWNDGSTQGDGYGAGGSGCSESTNAQKWQREVADWAQVGCGEKRAAADVAADGDPYSGVAIYRAGSWSTIGGTSLSSPIIAATFALAGGTGGVSYPAETLYGHLGSPSALHDVVEGSNGRCEKAFDEATYSAGCTTSEEEESCPKELICRAASGYDGPTGVGTPEGTQAFAPPAPTVSSISPNEGDLGTSVTIVGEDLKGVIAVTFGGVEATNVVEDSPGELTVIAPAHAPGQVDVTVTTAGGTSATSEADRFTYMPKPAIADVEPAAGPTAGGTTVTIRGERLNEVSSVAFGGTPATGFVSRSATELTAISPEHVEGEVDVTVTTTEGTSDQTSLDRFGYFAPPTITAVEPSSGPIEGGTAVIVRGEHLADAVAVEFGGVAAANVVERFAGELTVTSPAHAQGQVDVTVMTPGGTSATSEADQFTYQTLAPVDESAPTIEGFPMEGRTLLAKRGSWENNPTSYAYQWLRCNVSGGECKAISGATQQAYTLAAEDVGSTIEVEETASNVGGQASADSAPSAEVVAKHSQAFTWAGAAARSGGAPSLDWTEASNWAGGAAPSEAIDIGTLTLPSLAGNPACGQPPTAACYLTDNDIAGIEVEKISIDDRSEYITKGEPFTLGAGGIEASSSLSTTEVVPSFRLPITLGASQTWSIDGGSGQGLGTGGLELEGAITGESQSLQVNLSKEGGVNLVGSPDDEIGPVTITGADRSNTGPEASKNGLLGLSLSPSTETPQLNATDGNPVRLDHVAMIGAGTIGPLTVEGGSIHVAEPLPVEGTPYGSLTVDGPVSLDSKTSVFFAVGEGTVAGADYTQLQARGDVSLGGAQLVILGNPTSPCPSLLAGSELALVTTTGKLEGAFAGVPDGKTLTPCAFGEAPVLEISYTEHAVLAKSLGPVPFDVALPLISGVATGEETLTATSGGWQNSPSSYEYQWLRCESSGESCSPISGATGQTYKLAPGDEGHAFRVEVTAHNAAGETSATSAAARPPAPFDGDPPGIAGNAVEGETLIAIDGFWVYNPTFGYQWLRCDSSGGNCVPISGATAQTYVLGSEDVGHEIRVEVIATNAGGETSADSSATTVVVARHVLPVETSLPTISGSAVEGETLSATEGGWENSPTFGYQWLRCGASGADCAPISGATAPTYVLASEDVGHEIEVEVIATNAGGEASADSAPTAVVVPPAPASTSPPTISGSAVEGDTLSATDGGWENDPTSYAYQWQRCDSSGSNCSDSGTDLSTYTLTSEDVGHTVRVQVTAVNAGGQSTKTSAASALVAAKPPSGKGGEESKATTPPPGEKSTQPEGGGGQAGTPERTSPAVAGTAQASGHAIVTGDKAEIKLTCAGDGACDGRFELVLKIAAKRVKRHGKPKMTEKAREIVIASSTFSLSAGSSQTLWLKLNATASSMLGKAGKRGLAVKLTGSGIATRTLVLQQAPKKRRGHRKRHG